ncbi:MAG: methyltransferase domain-containing protein [Micromonosporaceae bacterium]|nr:methyltransferase domain-containing protein [Micromonosporaceae bacterium]
MGGSELILTGERTLPGIETENYWFRRHEAAYLAVAARLRGARRVLEAGVGEGYGAALLAEAGADVVGLDYDAATTAHVAAAYPQMGVVRGNVVRLPFRAESFDAVVSMQVVEHLWDQPGYVAECARVLVPGGTLVISTPNRLTFSPGHNPGDKPVNPFHTRELSHAELAVLVSEDPRRLEVTARLGLNAGPGLRAADDECRRRHGVDLVGAQLAAPPEEWPSDVRAAVAGLAAADFTVTDADVDRSLDLILIARRDC